MAEDRLLAAGLLSVRPPLPFSFSLPLPLDFEAGPLVLMPLGWTLGVLFLEAVETTDGGRFSDAAEPGRLGIVELEALLVAVLMLEFCLLAVGDSVGGGPEGGISPKLVTASPLSRIYACTLIYSRALLKFYKPAHGRPGCPGCECTRA